MCSVSQDDVLDSAAEAVLLKMDFLPENDPPIDLNGFHTKMREQHYVKQLQPAPSSVAVGGALRRALSNKGWRKVPRMVRYDGPGEQTTVLVM
jgi:hypothetical protein